jgi:hypothetical protein
MRLKDSPPFLLLGKVEQNIPSFKKDCNEVRDKPIQNRMFGSQSRPQDCEPCDIFKG